MWHVRAQLGLRCEVFMMHAVRYPHAGLTDIYIEHARNQSASKSHKDLNSTIFWAIEARPSNVVVPYPSV